VREYAANLSTEQIANAMLEKSKEFKEKGSEIYLTNKVWRTKFGEPLRFAKHK
jgi:hypothetical protein